MDGGSTREGTGLDQVQSQRLAQRTEQTGPVADHERMEHEPVLVDQPCTDQRVQEGRAAMGEDDAAGLALEPVDVLGQLATGNPSLGPVGRVSVDENTTLGISFITSAYSPVWWATPPPSPRRWCGP